MTNFERACAYRNKLLADAAQARVNKRWPTDYRISHLSSFIEYYNLDEKVKPVDPGKLTAKQMDSLGFGKQSEDENGPRLIPLWLHPFLPDEFSANTVNNETQCAYRRDEMDTDDRGGQLAYGVFPAAKPEEAEK